MFSTAAITLARTFSVIEYTTNPYSMTRVILIAARWAVEPDDTPWSPSASPSPIRSLTAANTRATSPPRS
jgi:hypothetical protein